MQYLEAATKTKSVYPSVIFNGAWPGTGVHTHPRRANPTTTTKTRWTQPPHQQNRRIHFHLCIHSIHMHASIPPNAHYLHVCVKISFAKTTCCCCRQTLAARRTPRHRPWLRPSRWQKEWPMAERTDSKNAMEKHECPPNLPPPCSCPSLALPNYYSSKHTITRARVPHGALQARRLIAHHETPYLPSSAGADAPLPQRYQILPPSKQHMNEQRMTKWANQRRKKTKKTARSARMHSCRSTAPTINLYDTPSTVALPTAVEPSLALPSYQHAQYATVSSAWLPCPHRSPTHTAGSFILRNDPEPVVFS